MGRSGLWFRGAGAGGRAAGIPRELWDVSQKSLGKPGKQRRKELERRGGERRGGRECARALSPCSMHAACLTAVGARHTACLAAVGARGAVLCSIPGLLALLFQIPSQPPHPRPPLSLLLSLFLSLPPSLALRQWEHAVLWQLNYGVTYGLNTVLFSECQRSKYVVTMEEDWLWIESKMQVQISLSLSLSLPPRPSTLDPRPLTLHSKPPTLNPNPHTRNRKSQTLHP